MNIFAIDQCPVKSAKSLPDKLVVKMPTESLQIAAAALSRLSPEFKLPLSKSLPAFPITAKFRTKSGSSRIQAANSGVLLRKLCGLSHSNHPSCIWSSQSYHNLAWVVQHGLSLCDEYMDRYGDKCHGAWYPLMVAKLHILDATGHLSLWDLYHSCQPPTQCMPDDFKVGGDRPTWADTTQAYSSYVSQKSYVTNGKGYLRKN